MQLHDKIRSCTGNTLYELLVCSLVAHIGELAIKRVEHIARGPDVAKRIVKTGLINEKAYKQLESDVYDNYDTLLPKWAFINIVAIFEAWMSDVLRELFREYPQKIKRQDIKSFIITESSSYDECLEKLIDIELRDIFYASPKEVTKRLKAITSIKIERIPELPIMYELKAARDIFLHNKGVVNKEYLRKSRDEARAKEGEEIKIDRQTLAKHMESIISFIATVSKEIEEKYKRTEKK